MAKTEEVKKEVLEATRPPSQDFKFDRNTVVFVLYLLYKSNMITRYNIRNFLKIINEPLPADVLGYLVAEERKAT